MDESTRKRIVKDIDAAIFLIQQALVYNAGELEDVWIAGNPDYLITVDEMIEGLRSASKTLEEEG